MKTTTKLLLDGYINGQWWYDLKCFISIYDVGNDTIVVKRHFKEGRLLQDFVTNRYYQCIESINKRGGKIISNRRFYRKKLTHPLTGTKEVMSFYFEYE